MSRICDTRRQSYQISWILRGQCNISPSPTLLMKDMERENVCETFGIWTYSTSKHVCLFIPPLSWITTTRKIDYLILWVIINEDRLVVQIGIAKIMVNIFFTFVLNTNISRESYLAQIQQWEHNSAQEEYSWQSKSPPSPSHPLVLRPYCTAAEPLEYLSIPSPSPSPSPSSSSSPSPSP